MTIKLKQSTASQEIPLGYFVDSTDGNTEKDRTDHRQHGHRLWKAGATTLANKNSGGATHPATASTTPRWIRRTPTRSAAGGLVHVTGALPVRLGLTMLPANVYESLVTGNEWLKRPRCAMTW